MIEYTAEELKLLNEKWGKLFPEEKELFYKTLNHEGLYNTGIEWAVLGFAMGSQGAGFVYGFPQIKPDHFHFDAHRDMWKEIVATCTEGRDPDPVLLIKNLQKHDSFNDIISQSGDTPTEYISKMVHYSQMDISASLNKSKDYVDQLIEYATRRDMVRQLFANFRMFRDIGKYPDTNALISELVSDIADITAKTGKYRSHTLGSVSQSIIDDFAKPLPATPTGIARMDEALEGGLHPGKTYCFAARPKRGKAQPVDAPVLTPCGWKEIGALKVGDNLSSQDGAPSKVTGVFPQGEKEIWKVILDDGREVECCPEHLWRVNIKGLGWVVVDTREVKRRLNHVRKIRLPQYLGGILGEDYGQDSDSSVPLDPYLIGYLIGNGSLSQHHISVSIPDEWTAKHIAGLLGGDMRMVKASGDNIDYYITQAPSEGKAKASSRKKNPLIEKLKELGLMGKKSIEKFIPSVYMDAPADVRHNLLVALMDSDGTVSEDGVLSYSTSSRQLAKDVQRLFWSLGASVKIALKHTTHNDSYRLTIRHPNRDMFVALPRKLERAKRKRKSFWRPRIIGVEYSRHAQAVCISVSHPLQTYITTDYVVTHNTMLMGTMFYNQAIMGNNVLYYAFEMGSKDLHYRFLARFMGVNSREFFKRRSDPAFQEMVRKASAVISGMSTASYVNCPNMGFEELKRSLISKVREHSPKGIYLDYLGKVRGPAYRHNRSEFEEQVADWLHGFAQENGIWIAYACQLNREGNLRGSDGALMAADMVYMLEKDDEVNVAWLKCIASRHTPPINIGSKAGDPGLRIHTAGPHFYCVTDQYRESSDLERFTQPTLSSELENV